MKSNIVKEIIGNGLAQILLKVIRVFDQLLLIPFFLNAWGTEYYGEWVTLSIIPAVLGFSDLGIGTAVGNSFVLAYAAGEREKAANLKKSGFVVISCTIILGFILSLIILFIADYLNLFDKTIIISNDAIISVTLLMVAKLITFYHHLIEGLYRGAQKAALGSLIYSGYSAVNIISGFIALIIGCGVVGYAFSQFLVSIIFTILYFIIGNKVINLKGCKGHVILTDIKAVIYKGIGYMINMIWQIVYFQGGVFVVRLTLGPESVTAFNTMRTACRSVSQMFNIVNGSVFPTLQYEYGKGNIQIVYRIFRLSILFSIIIGFIGVLLLILFGFNIYNLWTQSVLVVPKEVWYTFVVGILFNAVWWSAIVAYSVTNNPYNLAIPSLIVACLSVGLSYVLSIYLGLWGAVFGAIMFDVIMMFYVIPNSSGLLGLKTIQLFSNIKQDILFLKKSFYSSFLVFRN